MAVTTDKIIALAKAEVGYLEKATNNQLDDKTANAGKNNYTKYARDLDAVGFFNGNKNGYAWCTSFVCWLFYKAANNSVSTAQSILHIPAKSMAASVTYMQKYFKSASALYNSPKVGDLVMFNSKHVGLVIAVNSNGSFTTIEGNTSSGDNTVIENGGGVFLKKYSSVKSGYVFGRPKYDTATISEVVSTPTTTVEKTSTTTSGHTALSKGDTGTEVKTLQKYLVNLGYSVGISGIDGSYGNATKAAVEAFLKAHCLTVDGKCGPATWKAIDEAIRIKNAGYIQVKTTALSGLNVRATGSTNGKFIKTLKVNTIVCITKTKNNWGYIEDGSGWIFLKYTVKI